MIDATDSLTGVRVGSGVSRRQFTLYLSPTLLVEHRALLRKAQFGSPGCLFMELLNDGDDVMTAGMCHAASPLLMAQLNGLICSSNFVVSDQVNSLFC